MDSSNLRVLGDPCFFVTVLDDAKFEDLYLELSGKNKGAIVRKIRGRKSLSIDDFFNEVSAALQFPFYFGENWNALSDCLADLDWLVGDMFVVLVSETMLLMREWNGEEISTLLRVLARANKDWLKPSAFIPRDSVPTPFHVIFQCTEETIQDFVSQMHRVGVTYERV